MSDNTVSLHRILKAAPEKVAKANERANRVFKPVSVGTEVSIVQEGIPSVIPVEMCYLGWQDSLDKLTRLVEPVIPDA